MATTAELTEDYDKLVEEYTEASGEILTSMQKLIGKLFTKIEMLGEENAELRQKLEDTSSSKRI